MFYVKCDINIFLSEKHNNSKALDFCQRRLTLLYVVASMLRYSGGFSPCEYLVKIGHMCLESRLDR